MKPHPQIGRFKFVTLHDRHGWALWYDRADGIGSFRIAALLLRHRRVIFHLDSVRREITRVRRSRTSAQDLESRR